MIESSRKKAVTAKGQGSPGARLTPVLWGLGGLAIGIWSTLMLRPSGAAERVEQPRPAIGALSTSGGYSADLGPPSITPSAMTPSVLGPTAFGPMDPSASTKATSPALVPMKALATGPQHQTPATTPVDPFGGSALILPNSRIGASGLSGFHGAKFDETRPGLRGLIFSGQLPAPTVLPIKEMTSPATAPADPLLRSLVKRGLPKPPVALETTSMAGGERSATMPAQGSTLISIADSVTDRRAATQILSNDVAQAGGKTQVLGDPTSEGNAKIQTLLITIPEAGLPEVLRRIDDTGTVSDRETWRGTPTARQRRVVETTESKIASLKKMRDALLLTYSEDAAVVRDVDRDIAQATTNLDQMVIPPGTEQMVVIRLTFLEG